MFRKPEDIRATLARNGLSIAAWARSHGFSEALTYRVMRGHAAKLGQSHRIAVALGLKDGDTNEAHELNFATKETHSPTESAATSATKSEQI